MLVKSEWEIKVEESRINLWLVTTTVGKFVCKKIKGVFFVKDCKDQLPVQGTVLYNEQL